LEGILDVKNDNDDILWVSKNGSDSLGAGLWPVGVALKPPQGSGQLEQCWHDVALSSWLCWSKGMHPLPSPRQSMVRDKTRLMCLMTRQILSVSSILKTTLVDESKAISFGCFG
jgi:hypothetical protein